MIRRELILNLFALSLLLAVGQAAWLALGTPAQDQLLESSAFTFFAALLLHYPLNLAISVILAVIARFVPGRIHALLLFNALGLAAVGYFIYEAGSWSLAYLYVSFLGLSAPAAIVSFLRLTSSRTSSSR
ncbi:hypothetical protein ACFFSY_28160 [Paenibacillus aurantiacus]|uniref:Uncharacterized protein n=1 Tax=Paenibacillus aurantiacus TaxID=1936118 RepID=A0ABV5KZI3_9BACL